MKKIIIIWFLVFFWLIEIYGQDYMEWKKEANYVPNLILKGIDWEDIADSIQTNYPQKEREIRDVLSTIQYLKSPATDSIALLFNKFFEADYDQDEIFHEFKSKGRAAIPVLIEFLASDFATRQVARSFDWDEPQLYLCASDVAIKLIEEITGIYFHKNYSSGVSRLSDKPREDRKEIIDIIEKWYNETKKLSKPEAINYYLINIDSTSFGSNIYTIRNLAIYGDTTNALLYLEEIYKETKMPCRANMFVVDMAIELGIKKDLAMADCMHDIYDNRCMADHGLACVSYIFKYAKSHIPFDVLADIVSTERFSRYKRSGRQFIWHAIFNAIARTENPWTKSIMIELLRIDDELKGSRIIAPNWERLYKEQFEAKFRVCDFALYKLNELFPAMKISVDWNDRASLDKAIKSIIEKETGGK